MPSARAANVTNAKFEIVNSAFKTNVLAIPGLTEAGTSAASRRMA